MIANASTRERIFSQIDQNELVNLAMTLSDYYSPTGREQEIAQFVLNWFAENGFYAIKQEVEKERFNAVGVLKGVGGGPSLTFNGHLDVAFVPSFKPIKAYVSDGLVYGTEIANMKAAIATFMIGAKAIKKAGIRLKGDLFLATVVGEISTATVGEFQGPQDRGEGVGTRHLLANGVQSDYAIVAEGSGLAIVRIDCGVAYFRISTQGADLYTPFSKRADSEDKSDNAIVKMTRVIDTIENWARQYERRNATEFPGGRVEPKVSINVIQAGMPQLVDGGWRMPFKPSQTPATCDLYVDVRILPGISPLIVKRELEELLSRLPFECDMEMVRSQRGYQDTGPEVDHLSSAVEKAYESVFQSKPPPASPYACSMWTDANLFREVGIPTVKWGPSYGRSYPDRRVAEIESMVQAAKVYALTALEICGEAEQAEPRG